MQSGIAAWSRSHVAFNSEEKRANWEEACEDLEKIYRRTKRSTRKRISREETNVPLKGEKRLVCTSSKRLCAQWRNSRQRRRQRRHTLRRKVQQICLGWPPLFLCWFHVFNFGSRPLSLYQTTNIKCQCFSIDCYNYRNKNTWAWSTHGDNFGNWSNSIDWHQHLEIWICMQYHIWRNFHCNIFECTFEFWNWTIVTRSVLFQRFCAFIYLFHV